MARGKAEDAGGLTPAKDDNAAPYHFDRRSLPIFKCVDYKCESAVAADCCGEQNGLYQMEMISEFFIRKSSPHS